MRFTRLLVPLDSSELSAAVLPIVRTFGSRFGTEFRLIAVDPSSAEYRAPSTAKAKDAS